MKKHLQVVVITAVLCIGVLLLGFHAFLSYSRTEYEKNINQLEQFGESQADEIGVNVNAPGDHPKQAELEIQTPTPTNTNEPTETPTATPTITPSATPSVTPEDNTATDSNATANGNATTNDNETANGNATANSNATTDDNTTTTIQTTPTKTPIPSAPPVNVPAEFNGHIVAIDAGHQRKGNSEKEPLGPGSSEMKAKVSSGTTGKYTGVYEYVVNLDVALLLRDELESRGYKVVMIRETHDVNISNSERAAIANNSGAEIFLRLHCNGVDNSSVKGALTMAPTSSNPYVGSMASECKRLSQIIVDEYCAATGFKNKGIQYYDNMSGINWCQIPVTIIEMGFMTNQEDDHMLVNPDMQKKMAVGMANGVDAYFGL